MHINDLLKNEKLLLLIALKIFEHNDTNNNGLWDLSEIQKFFVDIGKAFNSPITMEQV